MYNSQKYIEKCLTSIANNIKSDFENQVEVIIINDGSKDNSQSLVENFIENSNLKNFKLINKENGGLSSARNTFIEVANSDYIWFIDADDYITENSIEKVLSEINLDPVDLFIYPYDKYTEDYKFIAKNSTFDYKDKDISKFSGKKLLTKENKDLLLFEGSSVRFVIKRSLFIDNNLRFKLGILYEDTNLFPKLATKVTTFKYVDFVTYIYVIRQGSIMRSKNIQQYRSIMYVLDDMTDYFIKENLYDEYKDELEFIQTRHIYYMYNNVFKVDESSDVLKELLTYLKNKFPNFMKNKYTKNEIPLVKFRYFIQFNDIRWILSLMYKWNNRKK